MDSENKIRANGHTRVAATLTSIQSTSAHLCAMTAKLSNLAIDWKLLLVQLSADIKAMPLKNMLSAFKCPRGRSVAEYAVKQNEFETLYSYFIQYVRSAVNEFLK